MQALLLTLAECVARGSLKVRLYTDGRIHAKVDADRVSGRACGARHGSRRVKQPDTRREAHPTELNVALARPESVAALEQWYGRLWDVSQDFHRELFAELGQCWAFETAVSGA